ncbi:DEAD/DEAH box helicase [Streptococcus macacae]|uniref:Bacterial SNF2 helicase associated n=1 Tax=Streptococcus macacae NCTC 11558 TaxID=764298 RepID=G5JY59_9STRE|nr:DEAD/DEAH box helicase [Streptococcus macacae]EHJ52728.1 bacterial SNF2 helicase associated [Streptococcus macacae NCTC 11558]SUN77974.1 SNF helicase [Streptococcus macacae NCTC 11558]
MSKLIPGRIRNKGKNLYEEGLVSLVEEKKDSLLVQVADCKVRFSMEDELVSCPCEMFQKKAYCSHLAAVEYYLKNHPKGKDLASHLVADEKDSEKREEKTSFGSLFLDNLKVNEEETLKYRLSVQGSQSPFSSEFWWTLKINRLPDERSYVVRDIKSFLTIIKKESYYQIGKNYYEPLSRLQFDSASQKVIEFLWRILPDSDRVNTDYILPNHSRNLSLPSGFFEEGVTLFNQLYEFSFEGHHQVYHHLVFKELEGSDHFYHFKVLVHQKTIELIINEKPVNFYYDNQYLLYQDTFYHLNPKQTKLVSALRSLPIEQDLAKHIYFTFEDHAKLADSLIDFKLLGEVEAPASFNIYDFKVIFAFDLADDQKILLDMTFDYGQKRVSDQAEKEALPFASNFKKEKKIAQLLEVHGFSKGFSSQHSPLDANEWYLFFTETLPHFSHFGDVLLSPRLREMRYLEAPKVDVQMNQGLLDISFDFSTVIEDDIDTALTALFEHKPYFINKSGKLVVFDEEAQKVSQVLQSLRAQKFHNGHLKIGKVAAFQVYESLGNMENVRFSKSFSQLAKDLREPENFMLPEFTIDASLRDYQMIGVQWMSMLDKYGFGGILADDMGLGKTLQTLAFLKSHLKKGKRVLILSPSSLIYNWRDECQKFTPDLDVAVSYGLKSMRDKIIEEQHQITITSYASFRQDFDCYAQLSFDYLILDEAQVMKNTQTKIAQSLRKFDVKNCFALSGTPIENNLLEIWSIFQIVLPGLLPKKKDFLKMSAKTVARYIKPFVMRRRKEEVLPELPDLIEINYSNELLDSQKAIYLAQLRQMQENISQSSDAEIKQQKIEILSGITRLRQICDTPKLFMDYKGESGKINSLRDLLLQIKESGHRALIFSQFKDMLALTEKEMTSIGLASYKITGSTPAKKRQEMTRAFNNGSRDAFLISLKAGGVGLNLTGADTVVLIDLWWNPAVEMQAISRAHRIGQKEKVEVYRLITRGTIEEKILELQESKKSLVTTVLDGNETRASMSIEEIKEILGISQ